MKLFSFKIYLLSMLIAVCSLALILTGCGATPSGEALSVYFVSDIHENGVPVFEVDLDTPTELTYKVTPSTADVTITLQVYSYGKSTKENNDKNRARFTLKRTDDNKHAILIAESEDFDEIEVDILVGDLTDRCIVRLKEYPKKIYLDKAATISEEKDDIINVGGEYTIHVFGDFAKSQNDIDIREMRDSEFNFLVKSDDETVLKVMDESRLKITTLKNKPEKTHITIYLLDENGRKFYEPQKDENGKIVATEDEKGNKHTVYTDKEDENYILKINITIIIPASSADILIEGYDKFITDGETAEVTAKSTDDENVVGTNYETELGPTGEWVYYLVGYNIDVYSDGDLYLDQSTYSVTITTDQDKFVKVDYENKKLKIRRPNDRTESLTAIINLTTSSNSASGITFSTSFVLTFNFPVS